MERRVSRSPVLCIDLQPLLNSLVKFIALVTIPYSCKGLITLVEPDMTHFTRLGDERHSLAPKPTVPSNKKINEGVPTITATFTTHNSAVVSRIINYVPTPPSTDN